MKKWIPVFGVTAGVFIGLDLIFLGLVARSFYRDQLGGLLAESPRLLAAGLFYGLFVVGILVYAVRPAQRRPAWLAGAYGASFGFFTYMTYELTNYAVIRGWPFRIVALDIAWGILVTSLAAYAGRRAMGVNNR